MATMRRTGLIGIAGLALAGLVLGNHFWRSHRVVIEPAPADGPPAGTADPVAGPPTALVGPDRQERYEEALWDALRLMGEQNDPAALASLQAAQRLQDTALARREIARLQDKLARLAAAQQTTQTIQAVLADGKPEDAARLAAQAISQYGDADAAGKLVTLKRQADALTDPADDPASRQARVRAEAEAALKENNLRGAVLALEQAVRLRDDAELHRRYDELQQRLDRYDDQRQRAAAMRREAVNLEDALAALQEAARAWDTSQVRGEIDDCTLALQNRRDRLGVADFEVRGEVGIPAAGRLVADELLPAFKPRFDLVERGQLGAVLNELKLEASDLAANETGRREAGRLAKMRFLVVGSVTRLGGLTVNARLVDVRTGLIVQTGRVVAATPEELPQRLPQLARMLTLSDEQKLACEQQLAATAPPVAVIAPLPPPPPVQVVAAAPPPVVMVAPPPVVTLAPQDFERIPATPGVAVEVNLGLRQRAVQVAVELGDDLFRRGCYGDAQRHFELALALAPGRQELQVRLDNCRPRLPPPPPVVRPRVLVFDFAILPPGGLPPWLCAAAADGLAPCFEPQFETVDRGQAYWYMARLGLTLRDLITDPAAQRCLAGYVGARYLVFGALRQDGGLNVATHMVDAESGARVGGVLIQVADWRELRCRYGDLARLTLLDPAERDRLARETATLQALAAQARQRLDIGDFAGAQALCRQAIAIRANDPAALDLLARADALAQQAACEAAARRALEEQQAREREELRRRQKLIAAAEAVRVRAEQEAALRAAADREAWERRRAQAAEQLLAQARVTLQTGNVSLSVQLFESATVLDRREDGYRELAQARLRAEELARQRAAEEAARRAEAERLRREAEQAQVAARVEAERQRCQREEAARRAAQAERDRAVYASLLDQAQRAQAQGQFDAAVLALQTAKNIRPGDEADRLLTAALVEQARATAQAQDAQARAELERRLAAEQERRRAAEAEAKRNQALYEQALAQARQALAAQRYEEAATQFRTASKIFPTDVVLTGLKQADQGQAALTARRQAEAEQKAQADRRAAEVQRLLTEGRAALAAQQHDRAIAAFRAAQQLAPDRVEVVAGLTQAEQARDAAALQARRQKEDLDRQAAVRVADQRRQQAEQVAAQKRAAELTQTITRGRQALAAGQLAEADAAFQAAARLAPGHPEVKQAQADLSRAREAATAAAANQQRRTAFQQLIDQARSALAAKQYDAAEQALTQAGQLVPGDATATDLLAQVRKARADAAAATAEEQRRQAAYAGALKAGRDALAARRFPEAVQSFAEAGKVRPGDPEAAKLLREAQQAQQATLDAQKKAEADRQAQAAAAAHRAEYSRRMTQGRAALTAGRFDEAVQQFTEAGQFQPGDPEAAAALKQAQQARDAARAPKPAPPAATPPKPPPPPAPPAATPPVKPAVTAPPAPPPAFAQKMQAAAALEKQQKYAEAAQLYQEALKLLPGDATATRRAEFARRMDAGNRQAQAKKWTEAVAEYEAALKLVPDDATAKQLLQTARNAAGIRR
jgi:tetratricopeptide (TPR) repeat protein